MESGCKVGDVEVEVEVDESGQIYGRPRTIFAAKILEEMNVN